jgi:hypothetical protein
VIVAGLPDGAAGRILLEANDLRKQVEQAVLLACELSA